MTTKALVTTMGKTTTKRWKTFIFVVEMRRKKGWSQAGGKRVLVLMVMKSIILFRLQLLATTTAITVSSFHQSLSFSYVRVNANNHVSPLLFHSSSITTSSYCSHRLNPLRKGKSKEDNIFRRNRIQSPRRSHCNGGMTMLRPPLFLTAAATASLLFASTSIPLESQAYYTTTTATTTTSTIMEIQQYNHPTINLHSSSSSSVLQLASSTITNPIGELKVDDTDTATAIKTTPLLNSIGQWFFVLYVVVSLLAGTKEIVGRLQKKLKNDE